MNYNGRTITRDLFDFGDSSEPGVLTTLPPAITQDADPVFVPTTDVDGNDIAGIHLPEVAVPLATYSGWNVRAAGYAGGDLCNATGQRIPFPVTKAGRIATRDPRLFIEERYPSHAS